MAALTYANIETRCANQLRIPTTNATEMTKLQALINEVYRDIYAKADWWWLVKREDLVTADDISAGTVAVTNASASLTFSSAPTPSVLRYVFTVPANARDSGAFYRITAHTAGAVAATMDGVYTGATAATASYRLYLDQYALPTDFGKGLFPPRRWGYANAVRWISSSDMYALKNYDQTTGKPQVATVWDFQTTGDPTTAKMLVVHPYPDDAYRMEIHYKQTLNTELSSTTQPFLPDDYRQILVYGTLARGFPIFLNDTERGLYFQNLFNDLLALMVSIQRERSGETPQLIVEDQHRRFYTRRSRRIPAGVNLGSFFDRWPMAP